MRILIAGDWHSDLHEEEVFRSLGRLGHEAIRFKWCDYFHSPTGLLFAAKSIFARAQNKFVTGPLISKLNRDLIAQCILAAPEIIFIYRGTHITSSTLRKIKTALPACILIGYNNDDPFAPNHPPYLWRHFIESIPEYDLMLAYRHSNLLEFLNAGAKKVELLRSWFIGERNHPVELNETERLSFGSDVVFVGHFEPDQRLEYLEEIVKQGFKLRLFGPPKYWEKPLAQSPVLGNLPPVRMVWGREYNLALSGSKVALCFLSKLNRDTYTRRCFEIPSTRTLMLSEYSKDLASLYQEGVEADYFRDRDELIAKLDYYVKNVESRKQVANNGFEKVHAAGHDVDSRMREMLGWASDLATNTGHRSLG